MPREIKFHTIDGMIIFDEIVTISSSDKMTYDYEYDADKGLILRHIYLDSPSIVINLNLEEPEPIKSKEVYIWDLVIKDMKERDIVGTKKYGTHLQPFNGRNALVDAYQEVLDLAVYLRQKIYEETGK